VAVYSYYVEDLVDPISIFAGVVQTGLYLDFFYVYFTKYVSLYSCPTRPHADAPSFIEYFRARNSSYQHDILHQQPLHDVSTSPSAGPAAKIKLFLDWPLLTIHTLVHILCVLRRKTILQTIKRAHIGERRIPALELYTTMLNVPSPRGTPSTVGSMR
jgi:hypothetical protein